MFDFTKIPDQYQPTPIPRIYFNAIRCQDSVDNVQNQRKNSKTLKMFT
jgi:hypothetical protein